MTAPQITMRRLAAALALLLLGQGMLGFAPAMADAATALPGETVLATAARLPGSPSAAPSGTALPPRPGETAPDAQDALPPIPGEAPAPPIPGDSLSQTPANDAAPPIPGEAAVQPALDARPGQTLPRRANVSNITLRVGWYPMPGYMDMPSPGQPDGYVHAYLQALTPLAGFHYVYVQGTREALLQQLAKGEIDLLGMAFAQDEEQGYALLSALTAGVLDATLFIDPQRTPAEVAYAALDGGRVGVLRGTEAAAALEAFAAEQCFAPVVVPMASAAELMAAVRDGRLVAGVMQGYMPQPGLRALTHFAPQGFYFGISPKAPAVARLLNNAMATLLAGDHDFSARLAETYLRGATSAFLPSEADLRYLEGKQSLTVALGKPWDPLLRMPSPTAPEGVSIALLERLAEALEVPIRYVQLETATQYDLIAFVPKDDTLAADAGLWLTDPYIALPLVLVTPADAPPDTPSSAAVDDGLRIPADIRGVPKRLVTYAGGRACLDAVASGAQPAALLNRYSAELLLQNSRYASLRMQPLPGAVVHVCFAVGTQGDARLLALLNHFIAATPAAEVNDLTILSLLDSQPINLTTIADQMPTDVAFVSSAAILLILALLVLSILHDVRNRQTRARTAEIAAFLDYATKVNDDVWVLDSGTLERWRYRIVDGEIKREPMPPFHYDLLHSYIHPDDMAAARALLHRAIVEDPDGPQLQYHIDCRLRYGDQFKWSRVVFQRMLPTPDHPSSFMTFIVDVDAAVRAEEEKNRQLTEALKATEQLSKAKSEFTAYISHEIRSPLNALLGYLALARNAVDDPARLSDLFIKSDYAANHLLQLVGDVLDTGTIESGTLHLASERFDVRETLKTLASIYNAQAKNRGITYRVAMGQLPAPCLMGDGLRIKQVVVNLLSNAMKFTPQGGEVTLTAEETLVAEGMARLRFEVRDTGIGMTEAFQERLFTAYERDAAVGQFGGTGLGLSIAKKLVTLMGGHMSVTSHTGVGSTFTVTLTLPVDPGACEQDTAKPGTPPRFQGKRLLLVEDNDMNLEIATELLMQQGGFAIDPATNGREAVERFTKSAPGTYDAILMDVRMPVMDGYEATRAIRGSGHPDAHRVPILAMTADAFAEDMRLAQEAGMDGHVSKPIDFPRLLGKLESLLGRQA